MAYLGRGLDKISNIEVLDNITFDGSSSYSITKGSVAFTPNSAQSCLISIDGVVQATNFTVSSSTIDFGVAIPSTSVCNFFLHYGTGVMTVPSDGSVTTAKLGDNAVTTAKIGSGAVTSSKLSSGKILQVVGTQTSTVFSTTSTSYVDVTGYSLSITPSSTSNKILVLLNFRYGNSASVANSCQLLRNTDVIDLGGVNNNLGNVFNGHASSGKGFGQVSFNYFDTPSSTSALTYKLQVLTGTGGTLYINNRNDGNSTTNIMGSLTLMEVSA